MTEVERALGPTLMDRKAEQCRSIRKQHDEGFRMGNDVYFLAEPGSNTVRYIGIAGDVADRFNKHIRDAVVARKTTPVSQWIASLVDNGKLPDVFLAARVEAYGHIFQALTNFVLSSRAVEKDLVVRASRGYWCCNPNVDFDLLNVEHVPAECRSC